MALTRVVTKLFGAGAIVQVAYAQNTANTTTTVAIPVDTTVPQSGEGVEVLSASITPTSATNRLKITVHIFGTTSATTYMCSALFQDSGTSAIATGVATNTTTNYTQGWSFTYYMTAGTTSPTTFKVRVGSTGGTFYLNGNSGVHTQGGTTCSSMTIEEIKV